MNDSPSNDQFDAEPLIHLSGFLGSARTFNAEVKLVLGNFGRLVNNERAGVAEFSPESSGTSVRRAIIADFTARTRFHSLWSDQGGVALAFNSGFIFDAQADADSQEVLDAASYMFAGPSIVGGLSERSALYVDLLLGVSELLTGIDAFRWHDQRLRFRPRVKFHLGDDPFEGLDIGFWGDLGWKRKDADAFTVFIAKPLWGPK